MKLGRGVEEADEEGRLSHGRGSFFGLAGGVDGLEVNVRLGLASAWAGGAEKGTSGSASRVPVWRVPP